MVATNTGMIRVQDQNGTIDVELRLSLDDYTPQDIVKHLVDDGFLLASAIHDDAVTYKLALGNTPLEPSEPLGSQGVSPGDSLTLLRVNKKGRYQVAPRRSARID